jgi:hypothetical protein
MKINITVDVTPEELREFLGLPDVKPIQQEMLEKFRERMQAGAEGFDPVSLMQPFLAPNLGAMESMQKAFWQAFTQASQAGEPKD